MHALLGQMDCIDNNEGPELFLDLISGVLTEFIQMKTHAVDELVSNSFVSFSLTNFSSIPAQPTIRQFQLISHHVASDIPIP